MDRLEDDGWMMDGRWMVDGSGSWMVDSRSPKKERKTKIKCDLVGQ